MEDLTPMKLTACSWSWLCIWNLIQRTSGSALLSLSDARGRMNGSRKQGFQKDPSLTAENYPYLLCDSVFLFLMFYFFLVNIFKFLFLVYITVAFYFVIFILSFFLIYLYHKFLISKLRIVILFSQCCLDDTL